MTHKIVECRERHLLYVMDAQTIRCASFDESGHKLLPGVESCVANTSPS
jgi:hypothetical protein